MIFGSGPAAIRAHQHKEKSDARHGSGPAAAGSMRPKGVSKRDRRFEVTGVPNLKAQSPPKR
jgi:hypothetical protein